jgi:ubiquinone/menaquinone biosynthesis C-methylase UbiE
MRSAQADQMNRSAFYRIYGKIERQIAPQLKYSQDLYHKALCQNLRAGARWLDIGCGHHILPLWRGNEESKLVARAQIVVGFDYDWTSLLKHRSIDLKVRGDISALPFDNETFDFVTANMVVEHLEHPEIQFREIHRVLKPGGVFLFHTPNAYGYTTVLARIVPEAVKAQLIKLLDGRPPEDVFKTHYQANTESRISRIAQQTAFEVLNVGFIASSAKFAVIAPLACFELVWIRLLLTRPLRRLRTNLIVTLSKPYPLN